METKLFRNTKTGQTKLIPHKIFSNPMRMKGGLWQEVNDGSNPVPVVPVQPKPKADPTASMTAEQKELYERVTGTAPEIEQASTPVSVPPTPTKPKPTNKK